MPAPASTYRRDGPLVFAAIFLLFSPMGVLVMMLQQPPPGWAFALLCAIFGGVMSLGWAYCFMSRRFWLLIPLNVIPFVVPQPMFNAAARVGLADLGMSLSPQGRLVVMAVMCVVLTSAGFILFVAHMRTTERRTARAMAELDLARQVHATLVPPIDLDSPIAQVHGRSIASSEMGGDLIDAVEAPGGGQLDVLLGDVSGHGVGAGIVMAMLKGSIRTRLIRQADLAEVITDANHILTELTAANMFATFVALRLKPATAANGAGAGASAGAWLEYAIAGHLPILLYRIAPVGGGAWEQLPNECLPLGIDGEERFTAGRTNLAPGDLLVVFTDGLIEVQNGAGRELGMEGVAKVIDEAVRGAGPGGALGAIHERIMAGVNGHGRQMDDQSLVVVRVGGKAGALGTRH